MRLKPQSMRLIALFVAACTASARADYIGLRWRELPNSQIGWPGMTVDVYLRKFEAEGRTSSISGVHFAFDNLGHVPLVVRNFSTTIPGWEVTGVEGLVTDPRTHFDVGAAAWPDDLLTGVGDFVVGSFQLGMFDDTELRLLGARAPQDFLGVTDETSLKMPWNAIAAASSPDYIAFAPDGFGNPGWGTRPERGHQPTPRPLWVFYDIPEPATVLLLLAVGTFLPRRQLGGS